MPQEIRTAFATAQVAKQLCVNAGSSSIGGGSCPKQSSQLRSSKSGFMCRGTPISWAKKRWVGTCEHDWVMIDSMIGV